MRCSINSRHAAPSRGYTALELITAIAVACTGIFGTIHLYHRTADGMRAIQEDRVVREVLSNALEGVRAAGTSPVGAGETAPVPMDDPRFDRLHLGTASFMGEASEVPGLVVLQAEVRWIGAHGRLRERRLVTLAPSPERREARDE